MTFIRLLRLTEQGIKAIRNQKDAFGEISKLIEENGGTLTAAWFTQGEYDLVSIIECEDDKVMRTISARVAVKGLYTGKTLPAMEMASFVERFNESPEMSMFLETWFRAGRTDSRRR